MAKKSRDYYEVLGVPRSASADELRAAHRRLARELHPDVNKAPDAAERFSEVQEAYDVLSDEQKRRLYDRVGHRAYVNGASGAQGPAWEGHPGGSGGGGPRRGTYTWTNVGGPRAEGASPFDADDIGSIFEEFFGADSGGARSSPFGAGRARAKPARGRDVLHEITIPFDLALRGGTHTLRIGRNGESETVEVRIPKGVDDGAKLRLRGRGEPGRPGAESGDLILTVRIASDKRYKREGLDLVADLPVTIVEATLGAKVAVPTPGGDVEVTVPPGTPSGTRLRLRKRGVETGDGRYGDFHAVVKIVPPKTLSDADRDALRALGERLPRVRDDE